MSSTIPNERTLRKIILGTLLPAFPLLIASGIMSGRPYWRRHGPVVIFFGLIPTFFSAITSTLFLRTAEDPLAKRPIWRTGLWFLIDAFLAPSYLAVLLPVWMFEPQNLNRHGDYMMLETYATVFLMSNMIIHAYLALYRPFKAFSGFSLCNFQSECPHCHGKLRAVGTVGDKHAGYSLLRAEEYLDDPEPEAETSMIRQSTDSAATSV